MTDPPPLAEGVARIHEHLRATESLAMDRAATHRIAEAPAVVADLDGADLPPERVRERLGHVRALLDGVDGTGHPEGDEHVAAARDLVAALLG
jgi:hypothetical protein